MKYFISLVLLCLFSCMCFAGGLSDNQIIKIMEDSKNKVIQESKNIVLKNGSFSLVSLKPQPVVFEKSTYPSNYSSNATGKSAFSSGYYTDGRKVNRCRIVNGKAICDWEYKTGEALPLCEDGNHYIDPFNSAMMSLGTTNCALTKVCSDGSCGVKGQCSTGNCWNDVSAAQRYSVHPMPNGGALAVPEGWSYEQAYNEALRIGTIKTGGCYSSN